MKTAWTSSLFPSCHGSNSASRAMLTTFSAKPASCSLFTSKIYLQYTQMQQCHNNFVAVNAAVANKSHANKNMHFWLTWLCSWWLKCHHGYKPCYYKNPHLANSTTSTASGAAICLTVGPNLCTQLYSIDSGGNKNTEIKNMVSRL